LLKTKTQKQLRSTRETDTQLSMQEIDIRTAASTLGRIGGSRVSRAKTLACQRNSRKRRPNPKSLRQRAKRAGLPVNVVYIRVQRGWPERRALSTPIRNYKQAA
jgi:hypothetical protein